MSQAFAASATLALMLSSAACVALADEQQNSEQWRASKLVGVQIYGANNTNVGKITDVLMNHEGKAQAIVIGVGGFLGIGEKDVAVPYEQVKFTDQPITPPVNPVPATGTGTANNLAATPPGNATLAGGSANATVGGMAPNGGVAPGTAVGLGTPSDTMGQPAAMAAAGAGMPRSTSYPDHGTVDMTADQLKNAPTFHFAK